MAANPRGTPLDAQLEALDRSADDQPATLVGFITRDGRIRPIPGQQVPWVGATATASSDGYKGIAPATDDGDEVKIAADLYGHLYVIVAPPSTSPWSKSATSSPAGEASHSVAKPATWLEVVAFNNTAATAYLMIFDDATLPANGTVPDVTAIAVGAGDTVAVDVGPDGLTFTKGVTVALSSTPLSLTLDGATNSFTIVYHVT